MSINGHIAMNEGYSLVSSRLYALLSGLIVLELFETEML